MHNKRHPRAMGRAEIKAFLTQPAAARRVAPTTANQALLYSIEAKKNAAAEG